jgi:hypothetical protein
MKKRDKSIYDQNTIDTIHLIAVAGTDVDFVKKCTSMPPDHPVMKYIMSFVKTVEGVHVLEIARRYNMSASNFGKIGPVLINSQELFVIDTLMGGLCEVATEMAVEGFSEVLK